MHAGRAILEVRVSERVSFGPPHSLPPNPGLSPHRHPGFFLEGTRDLQQVVVKVVKKQKEGRFVGSPTMSEFPNHGWRAV